MKLCWFKVFKALINWEMTNQRKYPKPKNQMPLAFAMWMWAIRVKSLWRNKLYTSRAQSRGKNIAFKALVEQRDSSPYSVFWETQRSLGELISLEEESSEKEVWGQWILRGWGYGLLWKDYKENWKTKTYSSFFPFWILKEPLNIIIEGINHQRMFRLGKNYSLEEWLNTGTGSPGKPVSHHPWKCSRNE